MLPIFVSLFLSVHAADPLLDRMEGDWTAQGVRHQFASGRKIQLKSKVTSRLENGKLHTLNHVEEFDGVHAEPTRVYDRDYWVWAKTDAAGDYEFGDGTGRVSGTGHFDGQFLEVLQLVGTELSVLSRTEFRSVDETEYVETGRIGGKAYVETTLSYRRQRP